MPFLDNQQSNSKVNIQDKKYLTTLICLHIHCNSENMLLTRIIFNCNNSS